MQVSIILVQRVSPRDKLNPIRVPSDCIVTVCALVSRTIMDRVFHPSLLRKRLHRETRSVPHQALAEKKRPGGFQNGGGRERERGGEVARPEEKSEEK